MLSRKPAVTSVLLSTGVLFLSVMHGEAVPLIARTPIRAFRLISPIEWEFSFRRVMRNSQGFDRD
jgi:hypothetical protein